MLEILFSPVATGVSAINFTFPNLSTNQGALLPVQAENGMIEMTRVWLYKEIAAELITSESSLKYHSGCFQSLLKIPRRIELITHANKIGLALSCRANLEKSE